MSRVLVTGGSGYLGLPTVRELRVRGHEVVIVGRRPVSDEGVSSIQADLLEPASPVSVVRAAKAEVLLHLAWEATPGRFWNAPDNLEWVRATLALVRSFAEEGRRVVVAGSCAEYDLRYGFCVEGVTPTVPSSLYGTAKHATRSLLEAADLGIELCWGRVFFSYGPGEPREKLVPSIVRAIRDGRSIDVGEASTVRDYLFVNDVASALATLVEGNLVGPVNIGSGIPLTLGRLASTIEELAGVHGRVRFGARASGATDPPVVLADARKLGIGTGWRPTVSLEEGLSTAIRWWADRSA